MTNEQRAALIALINSLFPVFNLIGIVSLTGDEISIIMLLVNNSLTFAMLLWKPKAAPTVLGAVAIFVLVFSLYASAIAPRASADWDPGGGGYSGYYDPPAADPGPYDWTPCYWNGC